MAGVSLWSLENPVFSWHVLCSAILLLKTILMSVFTSYKRVSLKSFSTPEDNINFGMKADLKPLHPDVERLRRCHQNDLENNLPFVLIGLLYVSTNPSFTLAKVYFSIFTVCRLVHTIVFLNAMQPSRFLAYLPAMVVNVVMVISVIVHIIPLCIASY